MVMCLDIGNMTTQRERACLDGKADWVGPQVRGDAATGWPDTEGPLNKVAVSRQVGSVSQSVASASRERHSTKSGHDPQVCRAHRPGRPHRDRLTR